MRSTRPLLLMGIDGQQDQHIAAAVSVAELRNAVLTPKRYLTRPINVDLQQLRTDASRLREQLTVAIDGMKAALTGLTDNDGGAR